MHFTHNPTNGLGLSGLRCRPGANRSFTFAARIGAIPRGDSYPAVETDPEIQRGQKIRAANVRERSASHWPRCRGRSGFPAPTLPRALRRWRCGMDWGRQPAALGTSGSLWLERCGDEGCSADGVETRACITCRYFAGQAIFAFQRVLDPLPVNHVPNVTGVRKGVQVVERIRFLAGDIWIGLHKDT